MKQWWKRIVAVLAVACIFLGTSRNVMAEGTQIPAEIVEKYIGGADKYYDVGGSVGNGAFEIKSTSDSLKAGDTVEVQIIYNAVNIGHDLGEVIFKLYYDKDLLQYSDTTTNEVVNIISAREDNKGAFFYLESRMDSPFNQNGCIATVQFTVKQDTADVTIYGGDIDVSSMDGWAYLSEDDTTDDGGYKMMSVTVEDTSVPTPAPVTGTFALSDGTAEGIGEIQIPINIQTNDGFAALGLTISYDPAVFDYRALEVDSSLNSRFAGKEIYPADGQIRAAFLADSNITDAGGFLSLTLESKESAVAGTTSDVTVTITQVVNYDEELLNGTGAVYTVTLAEDTPQPSRQPGDVNNDGNIDLVDALCVLKNYNGVMEFTDEEKTAADVDRNGTVDLVDALRIMKYYNGEISEF